MSESRDQNLSLGFVPTMGALHRGHLSLIEKARSENDEVCISIFVNPTQFGVGEDYESYPRSLQADIDAARAAGANYIYAPKVEDIYPLYPKIEPLRFSSGQIVDTSIITGPLGNNWEGESRPGHFEGVCVVVARLFELVSPTRAYFGEKDFQQLRIIENMVDYMNLPVEIVRCETQRDSNGLALSSRNRYLNTEDYQAALSIPRALLEGTAFDSRVEVDYFAVVDEASLLPVEKTDCTGLKLRKIFAGTVGKTRLLDNMAVN